MSSPAADIAGLLQTAGVGTIGTTIFIGRQPDSPDACITVFDIGGTSPNPVYGRDEPEYSILVRGVLNDYSGGYDKATEAKNALLGLSNQTVGDAIYALFYMRTDTTFISYDSNNRPNFSSNWRCNKDYTTVQGNRAVIA